MPREKRQTLLSVERLKEVLLYCPISGEWTWKTSIQRQHKAGSSAGWNRKDGYRLIGIDGETHYAHRLAFLWMTGGWPTDEVDHIDRNPSNCAWSNLRIVNRQLNTWNQGAQSTNTSGVKGVSFHQRDRMWIAQIYVSGKVISKWFKTKDEAISFRQQLEETYRKAAA
jgi:hypothetical protein